MKIKPAFIIKNYRNTATKRFFMILGQHPSGLFATRNSHLTLPAYSWRAK